MSALKPLVWEELGKDGRPHLRFSKPEVTPETRAMIRAAIKATPHTSEEWQKIRGRLPDSHERVHQCSGKATLTIPKDDHLRQPFRDPTPRDWRRLSLEEHGGNYHIRYTGSRGRIMPGDRKVLEIPADLETEGLTLERAVANGRRLEALLLKRWK